MAVRLILVSLVVLSISLAWAQQSGETGGSGRRISLRRFSSRKKVENTRNVGRVKTSADILKRRKQLLQRNPSRNRNSGTGRSENNQRKSGRKTDLRQRNVIVKTTKAPTTTERYLDVQPPVEKIYNNDKEIRDLLLDNNKLEDETPFRGLSEVRTVSSPSGFRSSNEQIVRVSFKKTTAEPETSDSITNTDIKTEISNEILEKEALTTQKPRRNQAVKVTARRRLGLRRRGQKPARNSPRVAVAAVTEREFTVQGASDPLKALLKTASEPVSPTEAPQPTDNNIPVEIEAAIREMKEDNRIEIPRSLSRGNSPRRLKGSSRENIRVNLRGRNPPRNPPQHVVTRKESNTNFRSFPARQVGNRVVVKVTQPNTGRVTQPNTQTPRTRPAAPRQRFETRPTVSPVQIDFETAEFFKEFDFPTSAHQPDQFNLVTEAPRSAFQSDQNFRVNNENLIAGQEQRQQVPNDQISINSSPRQLTVQAPQSFQASAPLQTQQFPTPTQPQSLNSPQQVLSQNPFNLLNTNNFQAFDAQFGGSVPTNPGASRLTSSIFAQPLPALLPARNVPVTPQNVFQATPVQPAASQFSNVQPASFSGHPADNINLQTGAFNLRTG
eukprot:GFUD01038131.1.p1 GENE.GFUD01038131.1~~GFUD01038131.1.p1  ORF type:complete len:611 (-),score=177.16 GFUD01038131.1:129-1961(-)